jgi:hypothetical protein
VRRGELVEAPRLARVGVDVVPDHAAVFDKEPARHHQRIAHRLANAKAPRLEPGPQGTRAEQLADAAAAEPEGWVEFLVRIGDGTRLRPALPEEGIPLSGSTQVHQEQRRQVTLLRALLELREVTPTERSAEVPQEYDQPRAAGELLTKGSADKITASDGAREELGRECLHGAERVEVDG